ncbi:MAG: DUF423 domain-containing protein [Pirellulaceae bacterium]|nr:DUF423 domain-containing protein [Pirellulaceae bacterium]
MGIKKGGRSVVEQCSGWEIRIRTGALVCGTAVLLGAFGAHALKDVLPQWYDAARAIEKLDSWKTAVVYQMMHGLALILVGLLLRDRPSKALRVAGFAFLTGILLFSGDLYLWVLSDMKPFAMIVPLGGVSFVVGWLCVLFAPLGGGESRQKETV